MKPKITYSQVGDNYDTKDPIKKLAQESAKETAKNLEDAGFEEIAASRGESAYVWKQDNVLMASVIEGLGTKNLVADWMYQATGRTFYDIIGHDTVATIINDLVTVGAKPLVVHAYWAIEDNSWLSDTKRMSDLIFGWKEACNLAGASWGGGETPTLKGITVSNTVDLGGCAIGIISPQSNLITDDKLQPDDRILLIKSNGVNANGLSLARAVAEKLPEKYQTKLEDGTSYGVALLTKTNLYAKLVSDLLQKGVEIHYISNITGHGLRKLMRARGNFSYIIENLFPPQKVFEFIQKNANLSDEEMYQTYNMGQDYAIFIPAKDMEQALQIIESHGFEGKNAGFIKAGERKVILEEKNITFAGNTLDLR